MDIVMPQLGETVTEGTVTVWHKAPGDPVKADEILFEISTDKVEAEVPAPGDGVLAEILVAAGETVAVGTRLAVIGSGAAAASPAPTPTPTPTPTPAPAPAPKPVDAAPPGAAHAEAISIKSVPRRDAKGRPLSPAVRCLIAENGLDIASLSGTGKDGRIKRRDVEGQLGRAPATGGSETIPLSRIRKQIGAHMVRSKATSPHVLQAVEVDFQAVDAARIAHGEAWRAREGFALSYLPFIAHAVCRAIGDFPHVNAEISGDNLVVHHRVDLGIAVDLGPGGLMAPVVRAAHALDVPALARAIRGVAAKARGGTITPDELAGGTYTLSNSGTFGTLITAPIINQPQVAILSTDGVRKKPVVIEQPAGDVIAIRPVGVLAQSFDHRAIDGAYSAGFLGRVRQILEESDWTATVS